MQLAGQAVPLALDRLALREQFLDLLVDGVLEVRIERVQLVPQAREMFASAVDVLAERAEFVPVRDL